MAWEGTTASETHLLKKLYQDFGEGTSMHGIGRVLTNNITWKRFLWSAMFLFGVGFSIYQFVITMNDFYSYPVTTVVTLRQETGTRYPGITICNLNRKRKTLANEEMLWGIETLTETEGSPADAIMNGLLHLESFENGNRSDHQMSDMLIKCLFNKRRCSASNFTKIDTATYGMCYTFEITDPLQQNVTQPGPQHGLILGLNIEQYEYLPISTKAGVYVIVHSQDETPFPEDGGVFARPGVVTSIGIKQEITQRLPSPYSNCIEPYGQSKSQSSLFGKKKYMHNACMKSCYQRRLFEICKCCTIELPCDYYIIFEVDRTAEVNSSLNMCDDLFEFLCEIETEDRYLKNELICDCPPACERTTFSTVVSSALWPSDLRSDSFVKIVNGSVAKNRTFADSTSFERFIRLNFLRLEIFLDSLEYVEFTTQAKYDWNLLLGTIGGLLGLWLGFSLLTAMEIVEVLIDTMVYCTHGWGKK